jgi:hypothetical protein
MSHAATVGEGKNWIFFFLISNESTLLQVSCFSSEGILSYPIGALLAFLLP